MMQRTASNDPVFSIKMVRHQSVGPFLFDYWGYLKVNNKILGEGEDALLHKQNTAHFWGFDFPIRAYFIDNSRFELFAFYELKTIFDGGRYCWNYSNGGVAFGVKF